MDQVHAQPGGGGRGGGGGGGGGGRGGRRDGPNDGGRNPDQAPPGTPLPPPPPTGICDNLVPRNIFMPVDGVCNNRANAAWGATNSYQTRLTQARYANSTGAMVEEGLPNPRVVSNTLFPQTPEGLVNFKFSSALAMFFYQFVDHDLTLTGPESTEQANIPVPEGDSIPDISFHRSAYRPHPSRIRDYLNEITAFLDLSSVYGNTEEDASKLRKNDGSGELLDDGNGFLPLNENVGVTIFGPTEGARACGDPRCMENALLLSFHYAFFHYHNLLARRVKSENPSFTDDEIYNQARKENIINYQGVIYEKMLPMLLGQRNVDDLIGRGFQYQGQTDPSIDLTFSTALYRFGHTGIPESVSRVDANGNPVEADIGLETLFFNAQSVTTPAQAAEFLNGLLVNQHAEIDLQVVDPLRNMLFGNIGTPRDLIAMNIQRGRDHGLASVNEVRQAFGLAPHNNFNDLVGDNNAQLADTLSTLYDGNLDDVDLFVAMLAEPRYRDSFLGEMATVGIARRFHSLKYGDRFFAQQYPEYAASSKRLEDVFSEVFGASLVNTDHSAFATTKTFPSQTSRREIHFSWLDTMYLGGSNDIYFELRDGNGNCQGRRHRIEPNESVRVENLDPNRSYTVRVLVGNGDVNLCRNDGNIPQGLNLLETYSTETTM